MGVKKSREQNNENPVDSVQKTNTEVTLIDENQNLSGKNELETEDIISNVDNLDVKGLYISLL